MKTRIAPLVPLVVSTVLLTGCGTFLPSSGPPASVVAESAQAPVAGSQLQVIELSDEVTKRAIASQRRQRFSDVFGDTGAPSLVVGTGDALEVSVWEAPPAALFGGSPIESRGFNTSSRSAVLPEQVVASDGTINVPFAGAVKAAGRETQDIERDIARRLKGKANDPQVLVRVVRNASSVVTVVGEVATSTRMALTPRGERLLDALAAAGGARQPVGKMTMQVTREVREQGRRAARTASLPLETIIADPAQNIVLQPGDVVTALYQPNALTVLGGTVRNEELNFEAQGITLAQALARVGGLADFRANPGGVFVFRFEDPAAFATPPARTTPDGKVPVVYRVDLRDPAAFFVAQSFPMHNRDIVYIANAPAAELQKFLNLVSSIVVPTVTVDTVFR